MRSHGHYFTLDTRDDERPQDHNLDAYYIWSNISQPFYDLDDDDGYLARREEAEVVSESTSWPAANTWYTTNTRWSHSLNLGYTWAWDPDAGRLYSYENLSYWTVCCWPRDKYDTNSSFGTAPLGYTSYPYKAAPPGVPIASSAAVSQDGLSANEVDGAPVILARASVELSRPYNAPDPDDGEVVLRRGSNLTLDEYALSARRLSAATAELGVSTGVLTFAIPVGEDVIADIESLGAVIHYIKGASTPSPEGLISTFYGLNEPSVWAAAEEDAFATGVQLQGIIAAEVTIPGRAVYDAIEGRADVFLLDLSAEDYRRGHQGIDVDQNDLYWQLAGWK